LLLGSGVAKGGAVGAAAPQPRTLSCTAYCYCTIFFTVHGTPTRNCNWTTHTHSKQRLLFCTSFYLLFAWL